jgi:hypothetical protein
MALSDSEKLDVVLQTQVRIECKVEALAERQAEFGARLTQHEKDEKTWIRNGLAVPLFLTALGAAAAAVKGWLV